jgi:hypothetical protein
MVLTLKTYKFEPVSYNQPNKTFQVDIFMDDFTDPPGSLTVSFNVTVTNSIPIFDYPDGFSFTLEDSII